MIAVIDQHNSHEHPHLVDEMFRLRARIFRDRLGWDVRVTDGMERDRFDDEGPVYVIYADPRGARVIGSLRLLPTTGPTLLAEMFGDTLPDAVGLCSPSIWECTRFCLDETLVGDINGQGLALASGILFAALGEVALAAGIQSILANFDATMRRLYRRIGCEVEILGRTDRYGRPVYLGLFPVSEAILRRVKAKLRDSREALIAAPHGGRPKAA
jgi:acyl homoserine lactone synthase